MRVLLSTALRSPGSVSIGPCSASPMTKLLQHHFVDDFLNVASFSHQPLVWAAICASSDSSGMRRTSQSVWGHPHASADLSNRSLKASGSSWGPILFKGTRVGEAGVDGVPTDRVGVTGTCVLFNFLQITNKRSRTTCALNNSVQIMHKSSNNPPAFSLPACTSAQSLSLCNLHLTFLHTACPLALSPAADLTEPCPTRYNEQYIFTTFINLC